MTRKHFNALAGAIRAMNISPEARADVAREIAKVCACSNLSFDEGRFFEACGVSPSEGDR